MKTPEERFNITPEPPQSCPIINGLLRDIKKAITSCNYAEKEECDNKHLQRYVDDIGSALSGLDSELEDLRSINQQLRDRGDEWRDAAIRIEEERDKLEEQLILAETKNPA